MRSLREEVGRVPDLPYMLRTQADPLDPAAWGAGGDVGEPAAAADAGAVGGAAVRLVIFGEPASKANSRKIVTFGRGEDARPALIKSKKARDYERDARRQITGAQRVMLAGPVRVTVHIWYTSERPDLDESVVLDVLQARVKGGMVVERGIYRNDRQVREKHVYHGIDAANPRAEIIVEPLQTQQGALL